MPCAATKSCPKLNRVALPVMLAIATVMMLISSVVGPPGELSAADQFKLSIPGNDTVGSTAVVDEEKLTLIDKRGRSFDYLRKAEMDSEDGSYRAYWSDAASQYLRWPVANAGSLQIGKRAGRSVSWRASQMHVVAVEGSETSTGDKDAQPAMYVHRIATIESPDRQEYAAEIDTQGDLQMYRLGDGRWRHDPDLSGTNLGAQSSVALGWNQEQRRPSIYSVSKEGRLYTVDRGLQKFLHNDPHVRFDQRGQITVRDGASPKAMLVDQKGRLWEVDLRSGDFRSIDARENLFLPETQLAAASAPGDEVFAIDKYGNALAYSSRVDGWSTPTIVGKRFTPGGQMHAITNVAGDQLYLASVDPQGIARVLTRRGGIWDSIPAPSHRFSPGSSVALRPSTRSISLSGIDDRGDWYAFNNDFAGDGWTTSLLGSGFDPRVPPDFLNQHAFAWDRSGRLVSAEPFGRQPRLSLLTPRYRVAPYIRTRSVIENPPLSPARIVLNNSSDEELQVSIYNTRTDAKISELTVPARGSSTQTLQRYSGATIEETLLIDDGFGNIQGEKQRFQVPAANVYHVVVWVNRVTSVYFDRTTNKGPIPDSESKSLVSLGVFPLPAGPDLADGLNIDVIRVVNDQKNPGAAGVFKR